MTDLTSYKFYAVLFNGGIMRGFQFKKDCLDYLKYDSLYKGNCFSRHDLNTTANNPKKEGNWSC